jgi:hypothetical protein
MQFDLRTTLPLAVDAAADSWIVAEINSLSDVVVADKRIWVLTSRIPFPGKFPINFRPKI